MSEAPDQRRLELLAELISPLVHRLNNLLAVTGGHCDVWAARRTVDEAAFRSQVEQVRAGALEAGRLLTALSELAKPARPDVDLDTDLEPILDAVRGLCTPFANEAGVVFTVERLGGDGVVRVGPRRLERALQLAVGGAVSGLLDVQAARKLVRLRVRVAEGRVTFAVTVDGAPATVASGITAALAGAGEARCRARGSVASCALRLPATTVLAPAGEVAAERLASILLVEPDDLLADLVASVLREEGYRVEVVPDVRGASSHAADTGLLLLEGEAAAHDPRGAAQVVAGAGRTLVFGDPIPELEGVDLVLKKPFRPDDLVRAVSTLNAR